jgi:hypothetical protein
MPVVVATDVYGGRIDEKSFQPGHGWSMPTGSFMAARSVPRWRFVTSSQFLEGPSVTFNLPSGLRATTTCPQPKSRIALRVEEAERGRFGIEVA